jgi:hypothetical protein
VLFGIGTLLPWNAILSNGGFFNTEVSLCLKSYNYIVDWLQT